VDTVAEILGVSVSVVKMQSARALIRLRAILGEDFILSSDRGPPGFARSAGG
jgi:DNA-directed RNA polymerase specialized sigma24 family protein